MARSRVLGARASLGEIIDVFLDNFHYLTQVGRWPTFIQPFFFNQQDSNVLQRNAGELIKRLMQLKKTEGASFFCFASDEWYALLGRTVTGLACMRFVCGSVHQYSATDAERRYNIREWQPLPPGRFETCFFQALLAVHESLSSNVQKSQLAQRITQLKACRAAPVALVAGAAGSEQVCSSMGEQYHCASVRLSYAKQAYALSFSSATELPLRSLSPQ